MGDGIHSITVLSHVKEVLGKTGYVAPVIMILCTGSHLMSKRRCRYGRGAQKANAMGLVYFLV
jgi:hypothetical protein